MASQADTQPLDQRVLPDSCRLSGGTSIRSSNTTALFTGEVLQKFGTWSSRFNHRQVLASPSFAPSDLLEDLLLNVSTSSSCFLFMPSLHPGLSYSPKNANVHFLLLRTTRRR
ncbi:hypothetical protein HRR83_003807 [Exophiala dermatitidis]|uniref:Uncharacterized protein n=1 Tax=Exophiala dermatitidis TaxID=5970 RepID=A0AAN6F1C5_EXODE|nr:hypothetical protein HRR74_002811 [Exophiala dermatitidis]KAJ4529555.1 hypothetical protein HRR73_000580 [Exophiala dermatitidis]KAJ4543784.1 hypothetical protein HRR76_001847 [Exophiala dermatitidis]KAJ4582930.1 hypothetical protein HRR81_001662 [Exophiala dermatitidis]KAJ4599056.1 hypothetical protein HRR83_003807 [Exophiala dermatitidis]